MYVPKLDSYKECDIVDIAKRRGIYASEVQDAIVELAKNGSDIYTMVMTKDPKAIEEGTDIIFSTNRGNFVWLPDGEFELIENLDKEPENRLDNYGKNMWDYTRRGQTGRAEQYQAASAAGKKGWETREKQKYAQAIRHAIIEAGGLPASIYVNKRKNDCSVKIPAFVIRNMGSNTEDVENLIKSVANSLGINVSIKRNQAYYGGESLIVSVPWYEGGDKK